MFSQSTLFAQKQIGLVTQNSAGENLFEIFNLSDSTYSSEATLADFAAFDLQFGSVYNPKDESLIFSAFNASANRIIVSLNTQNGITDTRLYTENNGLRTLDWVNADSSIVGILNGFDGVKLVKYYFENNTANTLAELTDFSFAFTVRNDSKSDKVLIHGNSNFGQADFLFAQIDKITGQVLDTIESNFGLSLLVSSTKESEIFGFRTFQNSDSVLLYKYLFEDNSLTKVSFIGNMELLNVDPTFFYEENIIVFNGRRVSDPAGLTKLYELDVETGNLLDSVLFNSSIKAIESLNWGFLGVKDPKLSFGGDISPNPTSGYITFSKPLTGLFELFDLTGKLIFSTHLKDEDRVEFDDVENGVYLLNFTGENSFTERIVVYN